MCFKPFAPMLNNWYVMRDCIVSTTCDSMHVKNTCNCPDTYDKVTEHNHESA